MKAAVVIGASRGIGRQIALTLANNNYGIIVAAKTVEESTRLPGTIYSVAAEIQQSGGTAFPVRCDCRKEIDIANAIKSCRKK